MCGFVGIFPAESNADIDAELLARMNRTQVHRGPDEEGFHTEPGLGFGHQRLSIIDLADGHQPLFNEDRSVVLAYNGEIYNFRELSQQLTELGHVFETRCDTEVVVHAWEEWGEKCVEKFRGMFAFAIWDRRRRILFLARDRLGIKPLYYATLPTGELLFSSELKALLIHPRLPREIDPRAVEDFFAFGYIPDPKSIFRHVFKLPPGHTLTVTRGTGRLVPRKYWDIPFRILPPMSEETAAEELIARLKEAVKARLVADVPLGAFLSGGVDSSAVVAMMVLLNPRSVNTCSISFGERKFDESYFASLVARINNTNHYVERVKSDDLDLIELLSTVYDEPYADDSALPTFKLCKLARTQVIVALSGDGGDENFAGYRNYRLHMNKELVRSLIPKVIRIPLFGMLARLYPKADWAPQIFRAKTTFQTLAKDSLGSFAHGAMITTDQERNCLFDDAFKRELGGYRAIEVLEEHVANAPTDHPLSLAQYLDLKVYLPADILTKVDRASMAHSLEVRVPILDHKFVEWVSGLPPQYKYRGGKGKYLFKKALRPYLPNEILYRKKMGFNIPVAQWLRGPLRAQARDSILDSGLTEMGIFNRSYLARLVKEHESGLRNRRDLLWALLVFEAFQRRVLES